MHLISSPPDLDAIARNLIALDLAHLSPEEAATYEHELSAIAYNLVAISSTLQADRTHRLRHRLSSVLKPTV